MGDVGITIKIMPSSPETDLEKVLSNIKEKYNVQDYKIEPIAFGLKAVILFFEIDESQELEPIEEGLKKIENINSVQVIDMRRAFG